MSASASDEATVLDSFGDPDAFRWLRELVALAPTNLEDAAHTHVKKSHYAAVARWIETTGIDLGLEAEVFDPVERGTVSVEPGSGPRPNVRLRLDVGAAETVLVLSHFDVVPVPAEQMRRWKSPPHRLTARSDGRVYGRGSNDDLGSGVVASLLAGRRLKKARPLRRNVQFVFCCDEETGGEGGIEAVRVSDAGRPEKERWLRADVALVPDGAPHVTAGSSGLVFLNAGFGTRVPMSSVLDAGAALVALNDVERRKLSRYASPDWPDHGAPEPRITGRLTVTQLEIDTEENATVPHLLRAHAETDATNQIPNSVTFVFGGRSRDLRDLPAKLASKVSPPYSLDTKPATSLKVPRYALAVGLVGKSAHGGSPHLGHNPVPAALELLRAARDARWIAPGSVMNSTFGADFRLVPEADLDKERSDALRRFREWTRDHGSPAFIEAPPSRSRSGYALPIDHPAALKLERIVSGTLGQPGIFGEYGGTDASSLVGLRTPAGEPLPALVFGSMDRASHVHEAEESADPALIRAVAETIVRFVQEP